MEDIGAQVSTQEQLRPESGMQGPASPQQLLKRESPEFVAGA